MDQPTVTLITGLLTSAVTIGGWIVLHALTVKREFAARQATELIADSVKRLEILLRQVESQIQEFYGPIAALIAQIQATRDIKNRIKDKVDSETYARVDHLFGLNYFGPLHAELRTILKQKLHLIEDVSIPETVREYVRHASMENIQIDLMGGEPS